MNFDFILSKPTNTWAKSQAFIKKKLMLNIKIIDTMIKLIFIPTFKTCFVLEQASNLYF